MSTKYLDYNNSFEASWRELFAQYWVWATEGKVTIEQNKSCQDYILKQYSQKEIQISIALEGGEVVAFCIFQIDDEAGDWNKKKGWGFIREFYVSPSKRKLGVGKQLLNFTLSKLKEKDVGNVYLDTDKNAKNFWLKCGFVSTGEIEKENNQEILALKI